MEDISSSDEDVSSIDAACSEAPSQRLACEGQPGPKPRPPVGGIVQVLDGPGDGHRDASREERHCNGGQPKKNDADEQDEISDHVCRGENSASFWVKAMLQFVFSTGAKPDIFLTP